MLLKTNYREKGYFSGEKFVSAFFSRPNEYEKPHGTVYKGPQYIVTVIGQVIRSFLWDLPGRR